MTEGGEHSRLFPFRTCWEPMQVVKRAAPVAVGVGTAAVSLANSTAECRSAVVTKEQLDEACSLIKNDLSKDHALTDATPWVMSDSQSDIDLLELSASVAADPTVQRVLQEKYEQHGLSSLRSRRPACTQPALSTRSLLRPLLFPPTPTTRTPHCAASNPGRARAPRPPPSLCFSMAGSSSRARTRSSRRRTSGSSKRTNASAAIARPPRSTRSPCSSPSSSPSRGGRAPRMAPRSWGSWSSRQGRSQGRRSRSSRCRARRRSPPCSASTLKTAGACALGWAQGRRRAGRAHADASRSGTRSDSARR